MAERMWLTAWNQVSPIAEAAADPSPLFLQYGAMGLLSLLAVGFLRMVYTRMTTAWDRERATLLDQIKAADDRTRTADERAMASERAAREMLQLVLREVPGTLRAAYEAVAEAIPHAPQSGRPRPQERL